MKKKFLLPLFILIGVLTLCGTAFAETYEGLTYENMGSYIEITDWDDSITELVIPEEIDGLPVQKIEKKFPGNTTLKSVIIPKTINHEVPLNSCSALETVVINSVDAVKNFYNCTSLKSVTLPDGLTSLANNAFSGCTSLTSIELPKSVASMGSRVFSGCSKLESITGLDNASTLGQNAFEDCTSLKSISLPKLTEMDVCAFQSCTALESVTSLGSLTKLPNNAFYNCSKLSSAALPEGLTAIGKEAFYDCTSLTSITLPKTVATLGDCAFYGCQALESVSFPAGSKLSAIEMQAFYKCTSLTKLSLPEGLTSIGSDAFADCTGLKAISLPDSLTSLGEFSFSCCYALESITLPGGLTSVEKYAFDYCTSLTSVTLSEGITTIKSYAFKGCSKLEEVFLPKSLNAVESNVFNDALKTAYYSGSRAAWDNISKSDSILATATIVYNASLKTYNFIDQNGRLIYQEQGYFVSAAPELTLADGESLLGWYDNPEFIGLPVSFPYSGTAPTLYASVGTRNGSSEANALIFEGNKKYKLTAPGTTGRGGDIYFKIIPKETATYTITVTNDSSDYCAADAYWKEGSEYNLISSYNNTWTLTAGREYYYKLSFYGFTPADTYSAQIEFSCSITKGTASSVGGSGMSTKVYGAETGSLVIAAFYNGDTLAEMLTQTYNGEEYLSFDLPDDDTPYTYAKVFVWDSLEGMKPVFDKPETVY